MIVVYFDNDINELRCRREKTISLSEFYPCHETLRAEMDLLEHQVNQRKQEVIEELERVVLSNHNINSFLINSQKVQAIN